MEKLTQPLLRPSPRQNGLLAVLPGSSYDRLLPHLELVSLDSGSSIYQAGDQQRYAYFPTTSIVSKLEVLQDTRSLAIAMIGGCGVIGIALFMGDGTMPNHALVQNAGDAYRLKADVLRSEFSRDGKLRHLLLRHTQALFTQIALTAACSQHHTPEQQQRRNLLLTLDRLPTNELIMSQELIANLLGVPPAAVPAAARKLQSAGLIQYSPGKITVLDRAGLEAGVCGCYVATKREYARLLPSFILHAV